MAKPTTKKTDNLSDNKVAEDKDLNVTSENSSNDSDDELFVATEDLNSLFGLLENGELSEDFKTGISALVESRVKTKVAEKEQELEESFAAKVAEKEQELEESYKDSFKQLEEKFDEYVESISTEWLNENKLVLENERKSKTYDTIVESLKSLLVENCTIDLNEDLGKVIEEKDQELTSLKEDVNKELSASESLKKEIADLKKQITLREATKELSESQLEKVEPLLKEIDFKDVESFKNKVDTILEAYFKDDVKALNLDELDGNDNLPSSMKDTEDVISEEISPEVSEILKFFESRK